MHFGSGFTQNLSGPRELLRDVRCLELLGGRWRSGQGRQLRAFACFRAGRPCTAAIALRLHRRTRSGRFGFVPPGRPARIQNPTLICLPHSKRRLGWKGFLYKSSGADSGCSKTKSVDEGVSSSDRARAPLGGGPAYVQLSSFRLSIRAFTLRVIDAMSGPSSIPSAVASDTLGLWDTLLRSKAPAPPAGIPLPESCRSLCPLHATHPIELLTDPLAR